MGDEPLVQVMIEMMEGRSFPYWVMRMEKGVAIDFRSRNTLAEALAEVAKTLGAHDVRVTMGGEPPPAEAPAGVRCGVCGDAILHGERVGVDAEHGLSHLACALDGATGEWLATVSDTKVHTVVTVVQHEEGGACLIYNPLNPYGGRVTVMDREAMLEVLGEQCFPYDPESEPPVPEEAEGRVEPPRPPRPPREPEEGTREHEHEQEHEHGEEAGAGKLTCAFCSTPLWPGEECPKCGAPAQALTTEALMAVGNRVYESLAVGDTVRTVATPLHASGRVIGCTWGGRVALVEALCDAGQWVVLRMVPDRTKLSVRPWNLRRLVAEGVGARSQKSEVSGQGSAVRGQGGEEGGIR